MKACVLYSGGKDSSFMGVMLKRLGLDVELCTANFGVYDSYIQASLSAKSLGFNHRVLDLDFELLDKTCDMIMEDGFPNDGIKFLHESVVEEISEMYDIIADGTRRDDRTPKLNINQIKSGNEFYISVKMPTDGTSQIKKITVKGKANVKHVTIKFWESTSMSQQNLLQYNYSNEEIDINQTFDYNIKILGNLKVIKVNKDNIKIKLQGVGFYVQNKDTKKWVKVENDTVSYTDKKEDATEFITDKNGEITIKNLVVGTYVAYETKNPNYGYEIIKEGQEKSITVDKTAELQIPNKQKYIKLSGYVWVDKVFSKQASINDLYKDNDYDSNDILLDGITVRLIDKTTGKVVKEAKTADGGKYLFTDVLVDELGNYYIEFEYDGLTYTNVIPHIDKDNGSKVAENSSVRDEFNKGFSVIEGSTESNKGITKDSAGNPKYDLNYNIDKNKHTSTLNNTGLYPIKANTNETGYVIKDHFTPGQEEIKYINLGLYEREQRMKNE